MSMLDGRCLDMACSRSLTEVPVVTLASVSVTASAATAAGLESATAVCRGPVVEWQEEEAGLSAAGPAAVLSWGWARNVSSPVGSSSLEEEWPESARSLRLWPRRGAVVVGCGVISLSAGTAPDAPALSW